MKVSGLSVMVFSHAHSLQCPLDLERNKILPSYPVHIHSLFQCYCTIPLSIFMSLIGIHCFFFHWCLISGPSHFTSLHSFIHYFLCRPSIIFILFLFYFLPSFFFFLYLFPISQGTTVTTTGMQYII